MLLINCFAQNALTPVILFVYIKITEIIDKIIKVISAVFEALNKVFKAQQT